MLNSANVLDVNPAAGTEKLARLKRLKISTRACTVRFAITMFLTIEKSTSFGSGPRSELRPTFPYSPGGGSTNAFGLTQLLGSPVIALSALKPGAQSGFCGFGSLEPSSA